MKKIIVKEEVNYRNNFLTRQHLVQSFRKGGLKKKSDSEVKVQEL